MTKAIDIQTLKMLMAFMKPEPIAPVLPLHENNNASGMAKDIQYIQADIKEMKSSLDKIANTHVTVADAQNHINDDNKIHLEQKEILNDHETRVRNIEKSVTRIMTWGTVILVGLTIVQVGLRLSGH